MGNVTKQDALADVIRTHFLNVEPDDQGMVLEYEDWALILSALMQPSICAALSVPCLQEPVAHLVWLQGRPAIDDVVDYYEVARSGDKSADGSEPFPVYAQPIAVREQAIRECAEAAYSGILQKYGKWAALCAHASILALREGR